MSGNTDRGLSPALAAVPLVALVVLVAFVMGIAVALGGGSGNCAPVSASMAKAPKGLGLTPELVEIYQETVPIYQGAAAKFGLGPKGPAMLASIHFNETTLGTNTENRTGSGAEGEMMFMPETWAAYGVDANGDGKKDPHDPEDAIFAAARYLKASGAPGNWHDAIFAYNHAEWYVEDIVEDFEGFADTGMEAISVAGGSSEVCGPSVGGSALLSRVERLSQPRRFKALPSRVWVGAGSPQEVDARIWANAVWLLETYNLRVSAAREGGHETHGDGTALDIVPASGHGWKATAQRAAEDLGWTEGCGYSGTAPICPLVPAIQFVGYNGYPLHGDPAHAGENAHLHLSWKSSGYGSCPQVTCGPHSWVMAFPMR